MVEGVETKGLVTTLDGAIYTLERLSKSLLDVSDMDVPDPIFKVNVDHASLSFKIEEVTRNVERVKNKLEGK